MTNTHSPSWRTLPAAEIFVWLCALTAIVLLVSAYWLLPTLDVFGHDEVHYYPDMMFKLVEDGRWLDILLHDFLRSVPLGVWACVWPIACWWLFFRVARALGFETPYAVLVAATIMLAPPFFGQAPWPASEFPATFLMLTASFFVARGAPYQVIYIVYGILIFGAYQTYYLLLPLLFLDRFISPVSTGERVWALLLKHMIWWVLGAITGVLIMSTILWFATDHFGVQPAAWRLTRPAHDLAGLLRNIQLVSGAFLSNFLQLLMIAGAISWLFSAGFLASAILYARLLFARRYALLLLIAVMISFFAMSVPLAPIIQPRSLMVMTTAIVLIVAFMTGASASGRVLSSLMLLYISYHFSIHGSAILAKHKAQTSFFYHKLKELMPEDPANYRIVALSGVMSGSSREAAFFNNAPKMHSVIAALGVTSDHDCRQGRDVEFCATLVAGEPIATVACAGGQLHLSVNQQNIAIITYTE